MPKVKYKNQTLDARADRLDLRDREYRPPLQSIPPQWPIQKDIDALFEEYINNNSILDQGDEGACTGFGLAAVINYLIWKDNLQSKKTKSTKVSQKMLYHMARIYDEWDDEDYEGSSCRGAMKGWHRHGVCSEKLWSYDSVESKPNDKWAKDATTNPLGAYYRINKNSILDMQAAILEVGAIYCSAITHKGWWSEFEKKDIISLKQLSVIKFTEENIGGHAFAIIGYNTVGFIIQNSWGLSWGYKGFAILTYNDWIKNGSDAWVAVMGAPIELESSPLTFSSRSLQSIAINYRMQNSLNQDLNNDKTSMWNEEKAYQHSLVIGNNGRPRSTIISLSPEDSADAICYENLKAWMQKSKKNRKIMIYGHGGLTSEEANIKRVRILAPYFEANGIYPLFVTWKTGFLESLRYQIEDNMKEIFFGAGIDPASSQAKGILQNLVKDAKDRTIEVFARNIVIRGIWIEMKENSKYASDRAVPSYSQYGNTKPGLMVILAEKLKKLQVEDKFDYELHLVGHSAGSILFGHWMDELVKRDLKVNTINLYAPVCTMKFANEHYIKACEKDVFQKDKLLIHVLDDELEMSDTVGPYGKSLSYLVSRALENIRKTPLLGMAMAWQPQPSEDNTFYKNKDNDTINSQIQKWLKFADNDVKCLTYVKYLSRVNTSLKGDSIDFAHGSFDNDIKVIEETIKQIIGVDKLEYRVKNLGGY